MLVSGLVLLIGQIADVERVTREIKILKRARHDNVIQLFEVIDSTDQIYLVMEYLDGGEVRWFFVCLSSWLKQYR